GLDFHLDHAKEIVVVTAGDGGAEALLGTLRKRFVPNHVLVVVSEGAAQRALATTVPLVAEKPAQHGRATAYVCEHRACQRPTSDAEAFARELDRVTPLS